MLEFLFGYLFGASAGESGDPKNPKSSFIFGSPESHREIQQHIGLHPFQWIALACLALYTFSFLANPVDPLATWLEVRGLFAFALALGMILEGAGPVMEKIQEIKKNKKVS